jgi:hypothetical protein
VKYIELVLFHTVLVMTTAEILKYSETFNIWRPSWILVAILDSHNPDPRLKSKGLYQPTYVPSFILFTRSAQFTLFYARISWTKHFHQYTTPHRRGKSANISIYPGIRYILVIVYT